MTESPVTPPKPSQAIRSFKILVGALITGLGFFTLIILLVTQLNGPAIQEGPSDINTIFLFIVTGLAAICLPTAFFKYRKKVKVIRDSAVTLDDKLNQYREALILYMALCEGSGLFSVIVFFLTGDYKLLLITGIVLAVMIVKFPQKQKIINELGLDWKEQQELG